MLEFGSRNPVVEFQLCLWLRLQTPSFLSVFRPFLCAKGIVSLRSILLKTQVQPPNLLSYTLLVYHLHIFILSVHMAKIPSRIFRFFAVPLCLFGPEVKTENLGEEFWFAVGLQVISKEFPLPLIIQQERKALSILKMREIIHRLGGGCLRACRIRCLRFFSWKGLSTAHSKENAGD